VTDKDLHELDELGYEENKGENEKAEEGVTDDFASDVAIKEAHGRKGECNMGEGGGAARKGNRYREDANVGSAEGVEQGK
jgi:hypothetical protein